MAVLSAKYLLSGVFALHFLGYLVIRMPYILDQPLLKIPDKARRIGYVAVLAALVFYLLYLVFRE